MARSRLLIAALTVCGALGGLALVPASASAHGPIAPVASSYLARITSAPAGLDAKVVDGDQRMWLRVPRSATVVVLDYRDAPYLRFSASGVWVNHRSAMWFLNQTPIPETAPANLGPRTPPRWQLASSGHDYSWHDGRLHALASVAVSPGARYVGAWRVPLLVDGRLSAVSGSLWHAADPSIVWFWPIAVLLLCVIAAWRVRRPALDRWVARVLALAALAAIATAAFGRDLHGRPAVSVYQMIELGLILAFVVWMLWRILSRRAGSFTYLAIALVALWQGALLIPTLLEGFVLMDVPAFVARAAAVVDLATGIALLLMVFRLYDEESRSSGRSLDESEGEGDSALELA